VLAQWKLALLGAVPALLAMAVVDRLDAKRPEPRATLRLVVLAGALSALPVYLVSRLVAGLAPSLTFDAGYAGVVFASFVVVAIPEEAAKLASMRVAWRRPEFDERMDGIVYGAHAGLGFALVENVIYLALVPVDLGEAVALFLGRACLAVPGHAIWGGLMGHYAARRRFDGDGPGILGGDALAVAIHGLYDAFLFAVPHAIADGHTWLGLGFARIPVVAYLAPGLTIVVGAGFLLRASEAAIASDDVALSEATSQD
jgi:RsiW-degrading membrane proteinase PrsW (M82 family)